MMKLLVLIAALAAPAAANFKFTRKKLSDEALAVLRTKVTGGASHVLADLELASLLGVEAGHAVPAKMARGAVREHQDKHVDSTAADLVQVLYLDVHGDDHKFTLRDIRSGAEHSTPVEAGLFISYENKYYTHRVDARSSSVRAMLGPMSAKAGVLEAVGCSDLTCIDADEATYECDGAGTYMGDNTCKDQDADLFCCTTTDDCEKSLGANSKCAVEFCETPNRRNLRSLAFGIFQEPETPIRGNCGCETGYEMCDTDFQNAEQWTCIEDDMYNPNNCHNLAP